MSKTKRGAIRRLFTLTFNELNDELDKGDDTNIGVLRCLLSRLEDRFGQLENVDNIIMQEMVEQDISQVEMNDEVDTRQEYRDKMNDVTAMVGKLCGSEQQNEKIASLVGVGSCCSSNGKSRYKLPKLELVKFNGEPKNWLSFWSQFKGIHENTSLSSEDKFQYLIQATAIDSPARSVVSSFPPTAENYPKTIEYLKSRFGKDKILIEVYVRDLLKLVTDSNNQYLSLSTLYDALATKLRALESLGVTSNKYAAMLYPLVELTLSEELLQTWERIRNRVADTENEHEDQLSQLMKFLQTEVEGEARLKMAKRSLEYEDDQSYRHKYQKLEFQQSTATDLINSTNKFSAIKCIFCEKAHKSHNCIQARSMVMSVKLARIIKSRTCFKCLQQNHVRRECKAYIKCGSCGNASHCTVMCPQNSRKEMSINTVSISHHCGSTILQTLLITMSGPAGKHIMRAIIDTGSHQPYITTEAAKFIGLKAITTFETAHSLFGGFITNQVKHGLYKTIISNQSTGYQQEVYLLDQTKICGPIPPVHDGPWIQELLSKDIKLSDFNSGINNIDVLIGADIAGTLFTGNIYPTTNGPVAFETQLGWTLMGQSVSPTTRTDNTLVLYSLIIGNAKIQDLWRLDLIGIHDSADSQSREELTEAALLTFNKNITQSEDGRYEVSLPWREGHQAVAKNKELSYRRLQSSLNKLRKVNKVKEYGDIFQQWLKLGIIEQIEEISNEEIQESYLPHHPGFNTKSLTTPIRPVFDASAKSGGQPSLNNCLETGPNLVEFIIILLLQFRMKKYGVIADIEKAFLQINIKKEDRNFLRFFWYENGKLIIYRHCRVVFGISSSPFLLAATLNHHLDNVHVDFRDTAQLLKKSTYVDNCVASVDTKIKLEKFMNESTVICKAAQFNLRGWVWNRGKTYTGDVPGVGSSECGLGTDSSVFQETSVSVLGLLWDIVNDTLSLDLRNTLKIDNKIITKRNILAATHRIFDPLGFVSAVTIVPKKMIQELFKRKTGWDEQVPLEISKNFTTWLKNIKVLQEMKIPRWVLSEDSKNNSIHIFNDACLSGYASVAFLRTETHMSVKVQLLLSKARVSTIKPITISRLELISCECGAKLSENLRKTIEINDVKWYFWSDSSNALSWIKREENWHIFIHNRVKKIKELTETSSWRHIPGHLNPADMPSRGCTPQQLLDSRWWEGPDWLRNPEHLWPQSQISCDETVVMAEKKNIIIANVIHELITPRYFFYFSRLRKIIRMIAWMLRWKNHKKSFQQELTLEEEEMAEKCLWRMVQSEVFHSSDKVIRQINAVQDEYGLWRVKTKLLMRQDSEGFRLPILLPRQHMAVDRLIEQEHLRMNHCDKQTLRTSLREQFWILRARDIVREKSDACKRCRRHQEKKCETPAVPLPMNRVRNASVFEVVGIDLGGPLYLEKGVKAWFVLFTCAVYRAVHLELVSSISTLEFIQALRRFIARRGRPAVIYTDNGTNFSGTENLMAKLDWNKIAELSSAQRIKWIFNPPKAPWWGGWWERIIGMVKRLLRRILGKTHLTYEEMVTILCDCEYTINSRPLTYLSESPEELIPLTPMMFLNDVRSGEVPDLDTIDSISLVERYKYRQSLRQQLRERFRKEYLSELVHRTENKAEMIPLRVGDVVLVETDNAKRVDWPIAKVMETYPGIDGVVRSVQIKVVKGNKVSILNRPTKQLYLLEASALDVQKIDELKIREIMIQDKACNEETDPAVQEATNGQDQDETRVNSRRWAELPGQVLTRSGRKIIIPSRLGC